MNYKVLKELLINIKNKVKCDTCHKNFVNHDITLEDLTIDTVKVICRCSKCETKTIIDIKLGLVPGEKINENRDHQGLQVKGNKLNILSQDDVLDFKNFIKDFSGDFKSLFKK